MPAATIHVQDDTVRRFQQFFVLRPAITRQNGKHVRVLPQQLRQDHAASKELMFPRSMTSPARDQQNAFAFVIRRWFDFQGNLGLIVRIEVDAQLSCGQLNPSHCANRGE